MGQLIDRRLNGKNKSAVNRQRFIRRFRQQIKKAVNDSVAERSITNIDTSEKINIPSRDISEPVFSHGEGGIQETVHPGNTDFIAGDKVKRPPSSGGGSGGSEASKDGEGIDDFGFELSREEFLEFFFEGLELPDLVKTQLASIVEHNPVRAGFTSAGVPTNINVVRSLKGALARRLALGGPLKKNLHELEAELEQLEESNKAEDNDKRYALRLEIKELKRRIKAIPFIDTFDLRYNNHIKQPVPSTRAVMFCLMDVSGSMDQVRKDIAKRFFILLYLFLTRTYEKIDLVFIRHHTIAKEVDEEEFFHSRETGGTVVSSALELMHDIISERYPSHEWNIYAAQASDGDNWHDDSPICRSLLSEKIMPLVQYYAYVEIMADRHQRLWTEYESIKESFDNFAMQDIGNAAEIFPVFRKLFRKQHA